MISKFCVVKCYLRQEEKRGSVIIASSLFHHEIGRAVICEESKRRQIPYFALHLFLVALLLVLPSGAGAFAAETVRVSSGTELKDALDSMTSSTIKTSTPTLTIELTQDIDAVASSTYSTKGTVIIDGKGFTIDGKELANTALRFKDSSINVTLRNATVRNMRSSLKYGGGAFGIYKGKITVENCAFIDNKNTTSDAKAANGGGAVVAHSSYATLTVTNSTFYGNSTNGAGGAILAKEGTSTVTNCTIVGNSASLGGGGIANSKSSSKATMRNSIVIGNTAGSSYSSGADVYYFTDSGYNLLGSSNTTKNSTSQTGMTVESVGLEDGEPKKDGGKGGSPYTIALLSDSIAIGAAVTGAPGYDQRGVERDNNPDIGAHEYVGTPVTPGEPDPGETEEETNVTITQGNSVTVSKGGSQQFEANIPVTWSFQVSPTSVNTTLSEGGALSIGADELSSSLTIIATSKTNDQNVAKIIVTVSESGSGGEEAGTIRVSNGKTLADTIAGAKAGDVIELTGDIDAVASSTYATDVSFTIDGKGFSINGNSQDATALHFESTDADVTIRNATFRGMRSDLEYGGGAVSVFKGKLTIENCAFIDNQAMQATKTSHGGGAVLAQNSAATLKIHNSTFHGNTTSGNGGAIFSRGATTEILHCTVVDNTANLSGGGVHIPETATAVMHNSIVAGNKSGGDGNDVVNADGNGNRIGNLDRLKLDLEDGEPKHNGGKGGSPYTIALLEGSAAIGAADKGNALEKDQRGLSRDDAPDSGAFEFIAGDEDGDDNEGGGSGNENGGGTGGGSGGGSNGDGSSTPQTDTTPTGIAIDFGGTLYEAAQQPDGSFLISLPAGTSPTVLGNLVLNITLPSGTTITPDPSEGIDFSGGPVTFTITAQDGKTEETISIAVRISAPLSSVGTIVQTDASQCLVYAAYGDDGTITVEIRLPLAGGFDLTTLDSINANLSALSNLKFASTDAEGGATPMGARASGASYISITGTAADKSALTSAKLSAISYRLKNVATEYTQTFNPELSLSDMRITYANDPSSKDGNSGGGCDAGAAFGLFVLAAVAFVKKRRK